ncbi:ATP-grasp domain-containing protein [Oleispirillum naphthae]|uniref:ATP-grasp domain-containing protein n=1 Tax=Oleispirillum naphthae TaxID=2838853 RepID=UPI0030825BDC
MPYTVILTSVGVEMATDTIMRLRESPVHDIRVVAVDRRADVNARHFADAFVCIDSWDPETFAHAVARLAETYHADMVLPLVDGDVLALAPHRDLFSDVGCLLACNRLEIVATLSNKLVAYEAFTRLGLPVPDWSSAETREQLIAAVERMYGLYGEVVVKPASAHSSRGVSVVRSAIHGAQEYLGSREVHMDYDTFMTRFVDVYDSLFPVVVMKRVKEPVHDLDVLAWNGEATSVVPRRRRNSALPNEGHEIVDSAILCDLGRDVAQKLGLSWLVDCDVMFDDAGAPCLIEVNPRPSLSAVVSVAAGVPLFDDMIALARGQEVPTRSPAAAALVVPYRTMATARG